MSNAISVMNLSKAYKRYPSKWARLSEWIDPRSRPRHEPHWVLEDVNFDVRKGEAVGIVGLNGAGKSTLLKLITGTSTPTKGAICVNGQLAALLELGMGFHPDFTGRQNAYMAAQLLGYQPDEIRELLPHVEAFAQIGDYFDEPVRIYSSGMQMRLAFSVASARRPDILIVDEALSVGDAYFQHKSFERIRQFRAEGTTLLIVSHDKQAIQSICDRSILLHQGRIQKDGSPQAVLDYYNAMLADDQNQQISQSAVANNVLQTVSGTGQATLTRLSLLNEQGKPVGVACVGQKVCLRAEVLVKENIPRLVLGYGIKDRLGQVMYGTNTHLKGLPVSNAQAGDVWVFEFYFDMTLGPGDYSIQTSLASSDTHLSNNYEWRDMALLFKVINATGEHFAGCNWMNPSVKVTQT